MGQFLQFAWLIPLLPFVGFLLISLTPIRRRGVASGWLATLLMALATAVALGVAAEVAQGIIIGPDFVVNRAALSARFDFEGFPLIVPNIANTFRWAPSGDSAIMLGYLVDPAAAAMLVMVTLVSTCIQLFSIGYMAHDPRQGRFFSFTLLFTAAMVLMVMSSNLLLFFIAWELMGLCSYLLIGFWYDRNYTGQRRTTPRQAAIKAFITTRIGDVLLMVGIAALWLEAGSLEFGIGPGQLFNTEFLNRIAQNPSALGLSSATVIALLLFAGTVGKSAQVPLHVWLPDAMEGPTPVSALIHAATMVAAGVFLVARTYPIFLASAALPVVAWIGAITALFAALVAMAQFDIKRILAYSTISQLGFMVAALGLLGWGAALFHLLMHAFFKALLFLGAGSVIHGMEGVLGHHSARTQDIRAMGGLRRYMPLTFWSYAAGTLALIGLVPFAGFWSKDEILAGALEHNLVIFVILLLASFLTAFYMMRQVLVVFFGTLRAKPEGAGNAAPHESPWTMTVPLVILALFAVLGGFINLPGSHWLSTFLLQEAHPLNIVVASAATVVAVFGMLAGFALYRGAFTSDATDPLERRAAGGFRWLYEALYIDALYSILFGTLNVLLSLATSWLDRQISRLLGLSDRLTAFLGKLSYLFDDALLNDGAERVAEGTAGGGDRVRRLENGKIQDYATLVFAGAIVLGALYLYLAQ